MEYTGLVIGPEHGMTYTPEEFKVIYHPKDGKGARVYDALNGSAKKRRDALIKAGSGGLNTRRL